jgi:hypothetical protein
MPRTSPVNRSARARSNGASRKWAERPAKALPPSLNTFPKGWIQSNCHDDKLPPQGDDRVRHHKRRTHHLHFV